MKRLSLRNQLEGALQSTQFDGLKVLTKDTILKANKSSTRPGFGSDNREEEISSHVPVLRLQKHGNPDVTPPSVSEKGANSEEEQVSRFMGELGHWL